MGGLTLLKGISKVFGPEAAVRRNVKHQLSYVEQELAAVVGRARSPVREAAQLTLQAGGKRLRPALALFAGGRVDDSAAPSPALGTAVAVELVHMGSLLHDDVVDGSAHRRGQPAVHLVWGEETAVSAGDYLFAEAFCRLAGYQQPEMLSVLAHTVGEMSWGELDQLQAAGRSSLDLEGYLAKIRRKTAYLFSAACRLGGMAAGAGEKEEGLLALYGESLGIAFQICDDILDYVGSEEELGKPRGGDLREGKLTLPAICALQGECKAEVQEALREMDSAAVSLAVEAVARSSAIAESRQYAWDFARKAHESAEQFPARWPKAEMIALTDYVVERSS